MLRFEAGTRQSVPAKQLGRKVWGVTLKHANRYFNKLSRKALVAFPLSSRVGSVRKAARP